MSRGKHESNETVPKAVISRLSLYLREVQQLVQSGDETVSSTRLGSILGLNDAQVRKDFAYFGQFGYPGIGYRCEQLIDEIRKILGTNRTWPVALVGCGNLGQALIGYKGFRSKGFVIKTGLDVDPQIVGQVFENIEVHHLDQLEREVKDKLIEVAILAVPTEAAQKVADRLTKSGITGILNFAPVTLNLPASVSVIGVDLAIELEQLSFAVVKEQGK